MWGTINVKGSLENALGLKIETKTQARRIQKRLNKAY